MDIEWAKDGITQELFILQARPETVKSQANRNVLETYVLKERGRFWSRGRAWVKRLAPARSMLSPARGR